MVSQVCVMCTNLGEIYENTLLLLAIGLFQPASSQRNLLADIEGKYIIPQQFAKALKKSSKILPRHKNTKIHCNDNERNCCKHKDNSLDIS